MMADCIADVTSYGAILLGPDVVCDGFQSNAVARVQSHVHADHMDDFNTSKGATDIFMSVETRDLLVLERNWDLEFRGNIKAVEYGEMFRVGNSQIRLLSSGHMLGAVQTEVCLSDGRSVGYSGDFAWPLKEVIKVDALVVDATCGSSKSRRVYSQDEVDSCLVELMSEKLKQGPVALRGHRGTLQKALDVLGGHFDVPVVCSDRAYKEALIYRKYGYNLPNIYCVESKDGQEIVKSERYIVISLVPEQNPAECRTIRMTTIVLSSFRNHNNEPVVEHSDRSYGVGLSCHADFKDTLAYIEATGAKKVVTDNTRGRHAIELAQEVRGRLNIEAMRSTGKVTRKWTF